MQIEKISENQIEVILDLEDLKQNDISIHSFMCNSSASQNLFFNILTFANNEFGFDLKDYEITIEAFSAPKQNSFILVITRVPKIIHIHPSKTYNYKLKMNKSFFIKFDKFEEFCMFCNSFEDNLKQHSSLYLLDNCYFLHIKLNNLKDYFRLLAMTKEFSSNIYNNNFFLDENSEVIIRNSAIEMCKRYFV